MADKRPQLTAASFRNVKPELSEFFQRAGEVPGLFLRVRPTGAMTWVFRYRHLDKPDKISLGAADPSGRKGLSLKEARDLAGDYRKMVATGKDPRTEVARRAAQAKIKNRTMSDVFDDLYEGGTHGETRPEESVKIFNRDLRSAFNLVNLSEFGPENFSSIVSGSNWRHPDGRVKTGKIAEAHKLTKKIIHHAITRGWLSDDPLRYSPAKSFGAKSGAKAKLEVRGKRNLSMSEIRDLFGQLPRWRTREASRRLLKFALASGQRISAILEMRRNEINFATGIWLLPETSDERHSKQVGDREIPLSKLMLKLLRDQMGDKDVLQSSVLVWPSTSANNELMFASSVRVCIRDNLKNMKRFSPHDLRRTFLSRLHGQAAKLRINPTEIELVVGHVLPGMLAPYVHPDDDNPLSGQLDVLETWGDLLTAIDNSRIRKILSPHCALRKKAPFI